MPAGSPDAIAKRQATLAAKKAALGPPPEIFVQEIREGEFFVYEKCLWLRLADKDLLGTKIKQYNLLSDPNGLFNAVKPGSDGKELNPDNVRILADDTIVQRVKLSWT